jgi:hypothetical protein
MKQKRYSCVIISIAFRFFAVSLSVYNHLLIQPLERHVMLLLDEIYVQSRATYKGGNVTGMAVNSPLEHATTVQTFVLCSLLSSNKDVAALVPVKNLTAENLKH